MNTDGVKEVSTDTVPTSDDTKKTPNVASSSSSLTESDHRVVKYVSDGAFDASEDPRFYKPIPEYESAHRWDPYFEWTEEEEKRLIRKVTTNALHNPFWKNDG